MARRAVATLISAALLAGCGGGDDGAEAPPSLDEAKQAVNGAPSALAALHERANEVIASDPASFKRELERLRGYPVVVNKWASWCAPCKLEFPVFQRVSARMGKRVAFVGVGSRDERPALKRFLADNPVAYPTFADPGEDISRSIDIPLGFPVTNFYDRRGRLVYQHAGPYSKDADLERDLRKYAL